MNWQYWWLYLKRCLLALWRGKEIPPKLATGGVVDMKTLLQFGDCPFEPFIPLSGIATSIIPIHRCNETIINYLEPGVSIKTVNVQIGMVHKKRRRMLARAKKLTRRRLCHRLKVKIRVDARELNAALKNCNQDLHQAMVAAIRSMEKAIFEAGTLNIASADTTSLPSRAMAWNCQRAQQTNDLHRRKGNIPCQESGKYTAYPGHHT